MWNIHTQRPRLKPQHNIVDSRDIHKNRGWRRLRRDLPSEVRLSRVPCAPRTISDKDKRMCAHGARATHYVLKTAEVVQKRRRSHCRPLWGTWPHRDPRRTTRNQQNGYDMFITGVTRSSLISITWGAFEETSGNYGAYCLSWSWIGVRGHWRWTYVMEVTVADIIPQ